MLAALPVDQAVGQEGTVQCVVVPADGGTLEGVAVVEEDYGEPDQWEYQLAAQATMTAVVDE